MAETKISERRSAPLLVAAAVAVQALALAHELAVSRVDLNDNVFHLTLIERTVETLEAGANPFDFWVSEWTLGYPVPRTYQPLGHLAVAGLHLVLGKSVELVTLFAWARYLLLCGWPLTVFASARLLGLRPYAAAAAAVLAPLVATEGLFGLEYGSYLWRGSGLFTQSLAMHLLALSLGLASRALSRGAGLGVAGLALGLTFLGHLVYGYVGALSIVLLALVEAPRLRRLARTAALGAAALAVTAFHLLPLLADAPLINRSRWEPAWKWDSFGAREVAAKLLAGDLLDFGRFPTLSLLALAGAVLALGARRSRRSAGGGGELYAFCGALLWLALYCGRPAWGPLLKLLGVSDALHLHRLLGGAHLFLIFLAGIALDGGWALAARRGGPRRAGAAVLTLALLYPALRERRDFLAQNRQWGEANLAAFRAEEAELGAILAYARDEPGRVFPGLAAGWGKDFRVGSVPLYAFLSRGVPAVAFLYHAMALTSDVMVHFDERKSVHYRLFNVSTVLAEEGRRLAPFLVPAAGAGRFRLWRAPGAGYFELVTVSAAATVDRGSFYDLNRRWLDSGWPARHQHLRLDFGRSRLGALPVISAGDPLPPATAPGGLGTVEWEERDGEVYRARVRLERPAHLLFKMTYHRNWRLTVDGEERRTVALSPGFLGAALEPGFHEVECRYRPEGWKTALLVLAAPLWLLVWWAERGGRVEWAGDRLEAARRALASRRGARP